MGCFRMWKSFSRRPALFFFNDTATTEIYTLSLHDALPIWIDVPLLIGAACGPRAEGRQRRPCGRTCCRRRRPGSRGAGGALRSLQVTVEPRLRRFEACPAREGSREVDVAPFRMTRRPLVLANPRKRRLHEPLATPA